MFNVINTRIVAILFLALFMPLLPYQYDEEFGRTVLFPIEPSSLFHSGEPAGKIIISTGTAWTVGDSPNGGTTYDLADQIDDGLLRKLPPAAFTTIDVLPFSRVGRELSSPSGTFAGVSYSVTVLSGTALQPAFQMFNLGLTTLAAAAQFQGSSATIQLDTSQAATPTGYVLRVSDDALNAPRSWTFDGWNGSTWIQLDAQTNVPAWSGAESRTYAFANTALYSRLRLNVTAAYNNGGIPTTEAFPRTGNFFSGGNTFTNPSGTYTASASSSSASAWQGLNGSNADWWLSAGATNEWLAIQFPSDVIAKGFRYQLPASLPFQHGMVTMRIQGATAAAPTTWIDIATLPTQDWSTGTRDRTFTFPNTTAYRALRVFGSTTGFGAVIGEMAFTVEGASVTPFFAISELTINGNNQQIPLPSSKRWLSSAADGGSWDELQFTQGAGNVTGTIQGSSFSLNAPIAPPAALANLVAVPPVNAANILANPGVGENPFNFRQIRSTTAPLQVTQAANEVQLSLTGLSTTLIPTFNSGTNTLSLPTPTMVGGVLISNVMTAISIPISSGLQGIAINGAGLFSNINFLGAGVSVSGNDVTISGGGGGAATITNLSPSTINAGNITQNPGSTSPFLMRRIRTAGGLILTEAADELVLTIPTIPAGSTITGPTASSGTITGPITGFWFDGNVTIAPFGGGTWRISIGAPPGTPTGAAGINVNSAGPFGNIVFTGAGVSVVGSVVTIPGTQLVGTSGNGLTVTANTVSLALASTTTRGAMPALSGNSSQFLNGVGAWATIGGSGGAITLNHALPTIFNSANPVVNPGLNSAFSFRRIRGTGAVTINEFADEIVIGAAASGSTGVTSFNSATGAINLVAGTNTTVSQLGPTTFAVNAVGSGSSGIAINGAGPYSSINFSGAGVSVSGNSITIPGGSGGGGGTWSGIMYAGAGIQFVVNGSVDTFWTGIGTLQINNTGGGGGSGITGISINNVGNYNNIGFVAGAGINIGIIGSTVTISATGSGGGGSYTHPTFSPTIFSASVSGSTLLLDLPITNGEGHTTGKNIFALSLPTSGGGGTPTSIFNVGFGTPLSTGSLPVYSLKSLFAGTGITLADNGSTVTISTTAGGGGVTGTFAPFLAFDSNVMTFPYTLNLFTHTITNGSTTSVVPISIVLPIPASAGGTLPNSNYGGAFLVGNGTGGWRSSNSIQLLEGGLNALAYVEAVSFDPFSNNALRLGSSSARLQATATVTLFAGSGASALYLNGLGSAVIACSTYGVFGASPVPKQTLPAAATDPASTMALSNAIRTAFINYGLAA